MSPGSGVGADKLDSNGADLRPVMKQDCVCKNETYYSYNASNTTA